MPRWWIFAPVGVFLGLIGVFAYLHGKDTAALTESEVINHYAARYVRDSTDPQAKLTDCVARPGTGEVWIIVQCKQTVYPISRFGGLISRPLGAETAPET